VIKPDSGAGDRRRVCRYSVVCPDALLGWWQDSSFTKVPVALINLSLSGCLLTLDRLPTLPALQSVWVHLHKESLPEWTEGRIITVRKRILRQCEVRVSFLESLGYEPFKRIIYGPGYLVDHHQSSKPKHEWDQFWK
jgi:hypothetical protein